MPQRSCRRPSSNASSPAAVPAALREPEHGAGMQQRVEDHLLGQRGVEAVLREQRLGVVERPALGEDQHELADDRRG